MKGDGDYNQPKASNSFLLLPAIFFIVIFMVSCNSTKRVESGQYLLANNGILYRPLEQNKEGKNNILNNKITEIPGSEIAKLAEPPELSVSQLSSYIKQKPNTKILGLIPLHLYEYNLPDPERTKERRVIKNNRIDEKNKKIEEENKLRAEKGKNPKPYKSKDPKAFSGEWLMNVGEPPVILDSGLMGASVDQLTKYLHTKGYFDGKVSDSVHTQGKKADIFYIIRSGKSYKIVNVKYSLDDSALGPLVYKDTVHSLINKGDNYDEDVLKSERERITKVLKEDGYYAFSKEYINYEVDTNRTTKEVTITVDIKKYAYLDPQKPDSVIETFHRQYYINNVIVQMDYNPNVPDYSPTDTVKDKDYCIVSPQGRMSFFPKILLSKILIKPHELFKISNLENTYAGLTQMKEFRYINIKWIQLKDSSKLDCYIQLMPNTMQSFNAEIVGDYSGAWGAQLDGSYQNIDLFKGAEVLQLKLKYSWQAQTLLTNETPQAGIITKSFLFNTQDIGPELSLTIPRPLFPFEIVHINPAVATPQTAFKVSYDYQVQPDYQRDILTLGYSYDWNLSKVVHSGVTLFEENFVNATTSPIFQDALKATNNFFLENSFNTHAITDFRYTFIFNNQALTKRKNLDYIKVDLEASGLLIHELDQVIKSEDVLLGIPYSHYIKSDIDFRDYFVLSKDDKLAFRFIAGAGVPLLDNQGQQLPFDRSFWAGGSNDIRAWAARTLGPGSNNQFLSVEQIGDIKLEGNIEYRVNLIKFFGLAGFIDAGNVWLMNKNPSIPHGEFEWGGSYAFYNQIAVGTGIGFRFDFTYFLFRLDLGVPLIDPSITPEWSKTDFRETAQLKRLTFNYGIGFPF